MIAARQIFLGRGGAKLPYDAEVEYLESTGKQWIDTGVIPNNNIGFVIDFAYVGNGGTYGRVWGTQKDGYSGAITIRRQNANSGDIHTYNTNGRGGEIGIAFDNYKHSFSINNPAGTVSADSTTITRGVTLSNGMTSTCWLFGNNNVSSQLGKLRIYGYKCIDHVSGKELQDMIPVRFANELGNAEGAMYDRVSKQLFRNQGTGAFLYGRDINPISARSYVNDGLVAMWDGIENAGWGVHDANATVWKDLSGNGYDLELRNSAHFDINSLVTAEKNNVSALLDRTLSYRSIEVCGFADESRNSSALVCFGNYLDSGIMLVCYWNSIQTYNGNYQIKFTNPVSARSTWSGTHDGSNHLAYVNGKAAVGTITTNNWSSRAGTFGLSGSSNYAAYNFVGNYYCVRLYTRALTAAEIAANYAIDVQRFNFPTAS